MSPTFGAMFFFFGIKYEAHRQLPLSGSPTPLRIKTTHRRVRSERVFGMPMKGNSLRFISSLNPNEVFEIFEITWTKVPILFVREIRDFFDPTPKCTYPDTGLSVQIALVVWILGFQALELYQPLRAELQIGERHLIFRRHVYQQDGAFRNLSSAVIPTFSIFVSINNVDLTLAEFIN